MLQLGNTRSFGGAQKCYCYNKSMDLLFEIRNESSVSSHQPKNTDLLLSNSEVELHNLKEKKDLGSLKKYERSKWSRGSLGKSTLLSNSFLSNSHLHQCRHNLERLLLKSWWNKITSTLRLKQNEIYFRQKVLSNIICTIFFSVFNIVRNSDLQAFLG